MIPIFLIEFKVGVMAVSKAFWIILSIAILGLAPSIKDPSIVDLLFSIELSIWFRARFIPVIELPIIIPPRGIRYWGL